MSPPQDVARVDDAIEKHSTDKTESGRTFDIADVDIAATLATEYDSTTLDPAAAARLRRKIDFHIMPLMCLLYLMTFADKTTLGQSAVLGIREGAHLTQNQFNWLGTAFYITYLVFQYPQNLALLRFPVANWMAINIFLWAVILLCHAACDSFGSLLAVRLLLGVCEGAITPGFLLVTSMFYTREEQTRRVGYWFLMNGVAVIFLGFVSFGLLHTSTPRFMPWQWLMVVTGLITLITSIVFWFVFPNSPTTAWFLSPEERAMAVQRIKANQTGVENKRFKHEQFVEALTDPKTYLFAVFSVVFNLINSLTNQRQIIVNEFGFTPIQTTLIGCVDGVMEIIAIASGVIIASRWPNGRVFTAVIYICISILGCILVTALPFTDKVGLLFGYWLSIFALASFAIFLSWVNIVTAGHTKKTTTNAIVIAAYGVGNAVSPQMWQAKFQPRNDVPWGIIGGAMAMSGLVLLAARQYLVMQNNVRARMHADEALEDAYIARVDSEGKTEKHRIDNSFLDLTDRRNAEFVYQL